MDERLKSIHPAALEVEMLEIRADPAHEAFIQAVCTALAAPVPPEVVAAAVNMSLVKSSTSSASL